MPQNPDSKLFDVAVIGAGIAGASVAAQLAREAHVVLLEMEHQPGYHTTGRSAAVFAPSYGPKPIRALTRASESFFLRPPEGFTEQSLFTPRRILMPARRDQLASLDALYNELGPETGIKRLDAADTRTTAPLLREGYAHAAILDNSGQDIDVHALHQGYLRSLRSLGGEITTNAEVHGLTRSGGAWRIATRAGDFAAGTVVNAAGAWADVVGQLAGVEKIGLVPKRRTALLVVAPSEINADPLPIIIDVDEQFYLKPQSGQLLLSPANEDPVSPCDVQPEEMDVALCIDRIEKAFDLSVQRIENKWAGLRSFVADKCPVVGYSGHADGFYWLAGQGGYGIQSSPALARLAAAEITRREIPHDILAQGLEPAAIRPTRSALRA